MKKEQWQAVYTPNNEEMLERRVRQTLSGLQEDAPARRISGNDAHRGGIRTDARRGSRCGGGMDAVGEV